MRGAASPGRDALSPPTGGTDTISFVSIFESRPDQPSGNEPSGHADVGSVVSDAADAAIEPERQSTTFRVVTAVLTFVLGLIYGMIGTVAHSVVVHLGPVPVPYGIVLALVGVLAMLVGLRLVFDERLPSFAAGIGVVAVVVLFSFRSVGGSVLIAQGALGLIWLFGVPLVVAIVLAWPRMSALKSARRTA